MSRYKKGARNSQHGSTTDKAYPGNMVVICAGTTGWMDEVGEAVDVTYFGFSMAFDIVSIWAKLGWYCLNGWTTTWLKKAGS